MKVKKLQLQNYGRFDDLTMEFAPNGETKGNVTIIVGNNGAGKSQILQALATGFSWFVNGLVRDNKNKSNQNEYALLPDEGEYIAQANIKNGSQKAEISLIFSDNSSPLYDPQINIDTERFDQDDMGVMSTERKFFSDIISFYQKKLKENELYNFPMLAQYTINRNVDGTSIQSGVSFIYNQFSGYRNFLNAGSEYDYFFQWFKDFEDLENENNRGNQNISQNFNEIMSIQNEIHQLLKDKENYMEIVDDIDDEEKYSYLAKISKQIEEKQIIYNNLMIRNTLLFENLGKHKKLPLGNIRQAIERFTDFKNIRIERKGTPKMVVEKDGEKLDVNQLSQGEKSLLALVGDIARRLAILNPSLDNPLQGEGVVLIDEVDLHLHPKWQQNLIDKLTKTFPNVQFILTTHSPHIVSDNPDVLVYILDNGELRRYNNAYGEDVNTLLNGVFGVSEFTPEIAEPFTKVRRAISHKELDKAENIIQELSNKLSPNNSELLRLQLYLAKAKLTQSKAG